jgi:hypothetical protein
MHPILENPSFRADLHKLLWIEPFFNRGQFDAGWSCRDHAFVTSCVLRVLQVDVAFAHGKCMYVQGADSGLASCGLGQEPFAPTTHTWLRLESGIVDLSPQLHLRFPHLPQWRPLTFGGVIGSTWRPSGAGVLCEPSSIRDYSNMIAGASHHDRTNTAVYWHQNSQDLTSEIVNNAVEFINSPLSVRLEQSYDKDIYAKAVLHLLEVTAGHRRSIAGVSHRKAWKFVDQQPTGATERLLAMMHLEAA